MKKLKESTSNMTLDKMNKEYIEMVKDLYKSLKNFDKDGNIDYNIFKKMDIIDEKKKAISNIIEKETYNSLNEISKITNMFSNNSKNEKELNEKRKNVLDSLEKVSE